MSDVFEHRDILGNVLTLNDAVVAVDQNHMYVGKITKLTPRMVKVCRLNSTWSTNKYAQDTLKIEGPEVIMYILKNSK